MEVVILPLAFRLEDAATYRRAKHDQMEGHVNAAHVKTIFKHRATWLSSAYFLAYVGTESAISGWIVSFLRRDRHAPPKIASLSLSGFWAGMATGRLTLGVVTDNIGVSRATTVYLLVAISLEILFAITSSSTVSVVLATMLGFFLGPLFPSGIVLLSRLLPKELHVAVVSFVASVGQVGGAILPFAIGAMVQGLGIQVFKYVVVVQLVVALGIWWAFSRVKRDELLRETEVGNQESDD